MSLISMLRKWVCFKRFSMYSSSMLRLGLSPIPTEGLFATFFCVMPSEMIRSELHWWAKDFEEFLMLFLFDLIINQLYCLVNIWFIIVLIRLKIIILCFVTFFEKWIFDFISKLVFQQNNKLIKNLITIAFHTQGRYTLYISENTLYISEYNKKKGC